MRRIAAYLVEGEIWVIVGLIVVSLFITPALPLVTVAAGVFWVIRWIAYRRATARSALDVSIGLVVAMMGVSVWVAGGAEITLVQVFRLLSGVAIYYGVVNWARGAPRMRIAITGISLCGLGLAFFALIGVKWEGQSLAILPATISSFLTPKVADLVNPNVMAGALVLILPISLTAMLIQWPELSWLHRLVAALATMSMGLILLLTESRGAWFAFLVGLIAMITLRFRYGWVLGAFAVLALVIAITWFGGVRLLEGLLAGTSIDSLEGRIAVWNRAIWMVEDFPLTGIGMGQFGYVGNILYSSGFTQMAETVHTHNLFLQVAVDGGLPTLIGWLGCGLGAGAVAWGTYRGGMLPGGRLRWEAAMGLGMLGSLIGLYTHGLIDSVTWGMVRTAQLPWVVWGLIVALGNAGKASNLRT